MKCPRCEKGMGLRNVLSTAPGKPFECRSCGESLKINAGRATLLAGAAVALCVLPIFIPFLSRFSLLWIAAICMGALYVYASFAAPYNPDEVLGFGKFELHPDGFRYEGTKQPFSAIVHLARYARKQSIEFIPMEEYLRLRIFLKGVAKPITLQNSLGLIFTTSGLQEIYVRLVEKTFDARIRAYLLQYESKGYFEYGGARFTRTGEVSLKDKKVDLRKAQLSLEPFKLTIKDSSGLFGTKLKLDTEIDQDVLLALLKHNYGITFTA